jgi:hypothetical protein
VFATSEARTGLTLHQQSVPHHSKRNISAELPMSVLIQAEIRDNRVCIYYQGLWGVGQAGKSGLIRRVAPAREAVSRQNPGQGPVSKKPGLIDV